MVNLKTVSKKWLAIFIAIILYYVIHEGTHLLLAILWNIFDKIRFVGIIGIQIVTKDSLNGIRLAIFSGLSSVVTISVGYVLGASPLIYKIKHKNTLVAIYYITLCFLILDPLYMSILSKFIGGGGDLNGIVHGLGISDIPLRIVFGGILIFNILFFKNKTLPKYNKIFKTN